jgi:hypothetical protein
LYIPVERDDCRVPLISTYPPERAQMDTDTDTVYTGFYFLYRTTKKSIHGCPCVLGLIFYNGQQNSLHGSPCVLGFIFYSGNKIPSLKYGRSPCVLGFIFYNGQPRNPSWVSMCTGFYILLLTTKISSWKASCTGFYFL